MSSKPLNELSHTLIGAAIEVHRELGPGLLESAYEAALSHELALRKIAHVRQHHLPLLFKQMLIEPGYRVDILAEDQVVIELKAVEKLSPIHAVQVLTYLRLGHYPLGLLINFNCPRLTEGIERIANHAPNLSATPRPPR